MGELDNLIVRSFVRVCMYYMHHCAFVAPILVGQTRSMPWVTYNSSWT